jgi:hypothetical protein
MTTKATQAALPIQKMRQAFFVLSFMLARPRRCRK